MAEMLGSAVVGETVSRMSSFLAGKHEEKAAGRDNLDRLELAHIKMKAALETSARCRRRRIIDDDECPSLVLWQAKLKRAAEECGEALETYKRRATTEDEVSSLPRRIAHTAKSIFSSTLGLGGTGGTDQQHPRVVEILRYERYADSAGELVRFMEFGSAPRRQQEQYMLPEPDPLVQRLLEDKFVWYRTVQGSQYRSFRLWPMAFTERGLEILSTFVYQDRAAPANNFTVGLHLTLRERGTDVVWITARCMRSFRPQLLKLLGRADAEEEFGLLDVRKLIHEPCIPSKDLKLCPLHGALMQSWRPGPGSSHGPAKKKLQSGPPPELIPVPYPEQAVLVFVQCRRVVPRSSGYKQKLSPPIELGFSFRPARTGRLHADKETAVPVEFVDSKQVHSGCEHVISVNEWDEQLLPKAISHLNAKRGRSTTYEAVPWRVVPPRGKDDEPSNPLHHSLTKSFLFSRPGHSHPVPETKSFIDM
ncbi:hypothetical protein QOZ80_2BG0180720 [Eleusine coracana subsp. coracana]|nr:hypothetical protein QOZ80_2BG0180720 [Eleusine coracana subsp. coracana]